MAINVLHAFLYYNRWSDHRTCLFTHAFALFVLAFKRLVITNYLIQFALFIWQIKWYNNSIKIVFMFEAFTKFIRLNSTEYEVKLVDTAGQDEYSIFPLQYSMDFHGYVLVYSITSSKSFQIVQIIYDKLLDMVGKIQWVFIVYNLLGNRLLICTHCWIWVPRSVMTLYSLEILLYGQ